MSFCAYDLGLLSYKRHGGEGLGDYVLFIDCLIPLIAGVPFTLGVLSPASSMSTVPIFSGASPTSTCVVGSYLSNAGTPQGLPSYSGLSLSLSLEPVPARLVQRIREGSLCRDA